MLGMDLVAVVAFLIGLALGAVGCWVVLRRRSGNNPEAARLHHDLRLSHEQLSEARLEAERNRAEAATGRFEAAAARAEAARADAEIERARGDVERSRAEIAEARQTAAEAMAQTAALEAQVAAAVAERNAAQARGAELAADRESLQHQFRLLSTEALERQTQAAEASAAQRLEQTAQLMAPMRDSLQALEARLAEVERERAAMTADLRSQVATVQLTGEQLRRETAALTTALRKPQVRGTWGELQLQRVIELAGMVEHCDFVQQETTTTDDAIIRPDVKVLLSHGKFVYVDAKVPLTSFLDAQEATEPTARQQALTLFARNVRAHVDSLASKQYWKADLGTPEFVVMFIPSEALLAQALQQMPDLLEWAAGRNVIVATPSTLIALLRSVAYGWAQAALADSAREVTMLGQELYGRLATLGSHFDKLGRSLGSSVKAYNQAVASMEGRVLVTARKLRDLKVTSEDLPQVRQVEETVRQIAAPELVEDATQVPALLGRAPRGGLSLAPESEQTPFARDASNPAELDGRAGRPGA